ncbi:hypothetical protein ACHQM5_017088 [Ranunculus cassubicifolius]
MAKRTDFAQKLLDDLRMKKEYMGISQNSGRSNQRMTDQYRDFKRPYRESTEFGSTMQERRNMLGKNSRSLDMGESSKQLVPVGRPRSYDHITDLSMALSLAFKNGGRRNAGGSLDFGGKYTSAQIPTLSHLHIKEICKGAQNLNQILKACYNGLSFDVYSTDIGIELLQGAINLEESLKMLVGLQQSSDYMVTPPRRQQKIRLLELEENDEANKKKQVDRPKFSFDKPKNKVPAQTLTKYTYHRRSASCDTFTSLPAVKKASESPPTNGRIPNIIAKLMGLEELPPPSNVGSQQKDRHPKQGVKPRNNFERNLQGSAKKGEQVKWNSKKPALQKIVHAERPSTAPETSLVLYVDKTRSTQDPFERKVRQGDENKQILKLSPRTKEKQENPAPRKQVAQATPKPLETINVKQEKEGAKKEEKGNAHNRVFAKSHSGNTPKKPRSQDTKEKPRTQNKKIMHSSITTPESKNLQKKLIYMDKARPIKKASTDSIDNRKTASEYLPRRRTSARDRGADAQDVSAPIKAGGTEQPTHIQLAEKVDKIKVHNGVNPRKEEEVVRIENDFKSKTLKDSVSEESRSPHSIIRSSKSADLGFDLPTEAQIEADCISDLGTPVIEESPRLNELEIYSQNPTVQDNIINVSNSQKASTISPDGDQTLMSSDMELFPIEVNHNLAPLEIAPNHIELLEDGELSVCKSSPRDPQQHDNHEQLTESEKHLKQILVNSQRFLNAAKALFGLQIPVGMLQSNEHKYSDEENKVALDCGYEVMKRKGRKHEFTLHPWANVSIGTLRITCLDDLVKDLHVDLEKLKVSTKPESNELDVANSLHEMLQKDIKNNESDVNCMWDLGWGDTMFAYLEKDEVVKDVEKHVLNGLLDELTRDILSYTVVIC